MGRLQGIKKKIGKIVAAFVVLFFLSAEKAVAQEAKRTIQAQRLTADDRVILDGRVTEDFWQRVKPASGFRMQEPREGDAASEKTEVYIAYTQDYLYMGVILYDSEPSKIKAYQKRRDAGIFSDDRFTWIFDTFNDQRNAYFMEINPNALRADGLLSTGQGSDINLNWDGIWDAEAVIGDFGWSAEIRIPFSTLNFDPESDTWGVNFLRQIRRKNETVLWTGYGRSQGIRRPQDAGLLTGLNGISQGIGLEVVPYGIAKNSREGSAPDRETSTSADAGLDINYSITPSLKASVTVNTDFAEAEVDQRRINLTRFPLFFPERRDFFLEGANIFEFAPSSSVNPFFSRRIGLRGGEPVPITYGARLLGNAGEYNLALLHVRTGEEGAVQPENFSLARVKRNIGLESTIGLVYTRRATRDGDGLSPPFQDRHTFGTDVELGTSNFLGDKNLQFQAFFVFHNPASPLDQTTDLWDRSTRGLRLNLPNDPWFGHVSYREFGSGFDPAVGFAQRTGFRRLQPSIGYAPVINRVDWIRELEWGIRFEHLTDLDFELLTQELGFTLLGVTFETGDEIELEVARNFERLERPFDIKRDGSIIIPSGEYSTWTGELAAETAAYRRISFAANFEIGSFWSGHSREIGIGFNIRPFPGFRLTPEYIHTDVDLDEGSFSTNLLRFEGNFDFTNDIFLTTNIQYDDLSELLGLSTRFRWIIQPGSDLFLVYNHNWFQMDSRFSTLQRTGTIKLTYAYRF
jgi:hypothetical protein